ncbi:MAG: DUF58 domain-containing protein [Chlorobi bacterium]|nr:DUF58 domain-containing protein [Chlorobiota bacterium]
MSYEKTLHNLEAPRLDLLARAIVEGSLTGLHRSPFHGFSSEFREHKMYTPGEPVKFIDWKVYAKTEKLYLKKFDEETNMRVRLIVDASSSMHYPARDVFDPDRPNKIQFAVIAAAVLTEILGRQRDAAGLAVFHEDAERILPEKTGVLHRRMMFAELESLLSPPPARRRTRAARSLHYIAESMRRRSLAVVFTDLWTGEESPDELIEAFKHLRYKSAELIVFHIRDQATEEAFDFPSRPLRFRDAETGEILALHPDAVRRNYREAARSHIDRFREAFYAYGIDYQPVDIRTPYRDVMSAYLQKRLRIKG